MIGKIYLLPLCVLLISSALIGCSEGHADRGLQRNSIRFTNPDGTIPISEDVVLDKHTGLMWMKDDNCIRTNYPSVQLDRLISYKEALDFIAGLNRGKYAKCDFAYNDWRLPTRRELRSLLDSEDSSVSIWVDRRILTNIQADRYWVSGGWYYRYVYPYLKIESYVWPVRTGNRKADIKTF